MGTKARRNRARKKRAQTRLAESAANVQAVDLLSSVPTGASDETSAPPAEGDASDSAPPSGPRLSDLDQYFFDSWPPEEWVCDELEFEEPPFVQEMAAFVARRRAHLARYVFGVLAVAAAVGLAALVKLAVVPRDSEGDPEVAPVGSVR
jgi:hypothetical protein